jgi:hypothetical protein
MNLKGTGYKTVVWSYVFYEAEKFFGFVNLPAWRKLPLNTHCVFKVLNEFLDSANNYIKKYTQKYTSGLRRGSVA